MGQNKTFNWHAAARMVLEQRAWKNKRFFTYVLGMVKKHYKTNKNTTAFLARMVLVRLFMASP